MAFTRPLMVAAGLALLSACTTTPTRPVSPASAAHDLAVDVVLDGRRVGGGQGTWFAQGVVLTTLSAVNDVPPTGELIVRTADGIRLPASLWSGGNPQDANAAYLFVHFPERFGRLAELPDQALCTSDPDVVLAVHPGQRRPAPLDLTQFDATDAAVSGTVLRGPTGCIASLLSTSGESVFLIPLQALQLVEQGIPRR